MARLDSCSSRQTVVSLALCAYSLLDLNIIVRASAMTLSLPTEAIDSLGKRVLDSAVAVGALVLLLPLFLASVLVIRLTSPGLLLHRSDWIGLGNAPVKLGALLLSLAHGAYLDEGAVFGGIEGGHLGGAGLDVFREESYRGRLCNLENVVLTPHIGPLTIESRLTMKVECVPNLVDGLGG